VGVDELRTHCSRSRLLRLVHRVFEVDDQRVGPGGEPVGELRVSWAGTKSSERMIRTFPSTESHSRDRMFALHRELRPLGVAREQIAHRNIRRLSPIDAEDLPLEQLSLVDSFNSLMACSSQAFSAQERFIADAAHELRSPVTALRLQIGLVTGAKDGPMRQMAEQDLRDGIDRLQRMIEQLLQLSRATRGEGVPRFSVVDLQALVLDVVADRARLASLKQIDLGAEVSEPAM